MSMRAARCSQADIARAIRAARQAGDDRIVEIAPDGTIRIVPPGAVAPAAATSGGAGPVAPKREFSF